MTSASFINTGIYSTRIGAAVLSTSLLLLAISMVPEIGTVESRVLEKIFLYFAFFLAPFFNLFGVGLAVANFFAPRGTKKGLAVFGILLNGLGLACAALGWILYLIFLFILSKADFVGPWR